MTENKALIQELDTLRERYRQLGQTTVELLRALDAVVKRGDALGKVGPSDRVWSRAKATLADVMGESVPPHPPAAPLRDARQRIQDSAEGPTPDELTVISQMEQLQQVVEQTARKLSDFVPDQWSPWLAELLGELENEAEPEEFKAFLRDLNDVVDVQLEEREIVDAE
ncbi:MAG: hypothetical protein MAG451_01861 [Anaerolineales bacterium]|nr:hypothetical protein [Anaerolineales bacterium]